MTINYKNYKNTINFKKWKKMKFLKKLENVLEELDLKLLCLQLVKISWLKLSSLVNKKQFHLIMIKSEMLFILI